MNPETSESPRARDDSAALDYAAVTRATGVRVLDGRIVVRVIGDDRVSFFHGMCSADVKGAPAGSVLPALFLTEHAHVISEAFIWVTDDALLIDIDADSWVRTLAHLERLLVADDVEFEVQDALAVIDIEGPRAADAARALGAGALAQWRSVIAGEVRIANLSRFGGPAVSVIVKRDRIESEIAKVLSNVAGSRPIGPEVLDTIRVENGIARAAVDTAEKTIALEARMTRAISFSKGCYLGQETIERATARGGLKKRMFGLKFVNPGTSPVDAALTLGGKEVGRVTSVVNSPRFGVIGLAMLHHSAWQPGAELEVGGGGLAIVAELPFDQSPAKS